MKILIVGYGSIGKRHIENLQRIFKTQIVILTKRKTVQFLKRNNITVVNSIKEALQCNPDIAIICNSTDHHIPTAIKLATKGIDIFIEKPLSNNFNDVKKLNKIIKTKKINSHVGCVLRFHPCLLILKNLLKENKIGRILAVEIENNSYFPYWHPKEDYKNSYAAYEKTSGGIMLTCIHEIDYALWLFSKPKNISAISSKISDLKIYVDDLAKIILLNKKFIIQINLNYFQKLNSRFCKIVGTNGILICDLINNKISHYSYKKKNWKNIIFKNFDINQTYVDELEYFINCIQTRKKSFNDVQKASDVLRITLIAKQSAQQQRLMKVD